MFIRRIDNGSIRKKLGVCSALIFAAILAANLAVSAETISYVDPQTVFDRTKLGLKYQSIVREYFESRRKILDLDADDVGKLRGDYEKQSAQLTSQARAQKEEVISRAISDFEKKRNAFQGEINKKNDELSSDFNQVMYGVIERLRRQTGRKIIVLRDELMVQLELRQPGRRNGGLDITDEVISEMNKTYGVPPD